MMHYSVKTKTTPDTIGCIELTSIAQGYLACDAMIKKAPVTLLDAQPVCPGKFFILIAGDVASVAESVCAGAEAAGGSCTGTLSIPNLSPAVIPAINHEIKNKVNEAVGIIETFTAVAAISAADAAVKTAEVTLQRISLLNGLGGKAYVVISGTVTNIEAALSGAEQAIDSNHHTTSVIIPRIHGDVIRYL